jgi:hypothetical protein
MKNHMLVMLLIAATLFTTIAKAQSNTKENNTDQAALPTEAKALLFPEQVKVYPTQCVNKLMIDNPEDNLLSYRIINTDGREISNGALRPKGTSNINVGGYPSGLYYISVTGVGIGNTFRFAKM